MNWDVFKQAVLDEARAQGATDAEVYVWENQVKAFAVKEGKVDEIRLASEARLCLRLLCEDKIGTASTELPQDAASLVRHALAAARHSESEDSANFLPPQTYALCPSPLSPYAEMTPETGIQKAFALEQCALASDPRIEKVSHAYVSASEDKLSLWNSRGLKAEEAKKHSFCYLDLIAKAGEDRRSAYAYRMDAAVSDEVGCVHEASQAACRQLGAKPIPTGDYPVVLAGKAMADLLACFVGHFSGKAVAEGRSAFKDAMGESVASPLLHLVDDPFYPGFEQVFDGEGSPSKRTDLIVDGTLTNFLHNCSTAAKAGVMTTANARRLASGEVGVGHSNLLLCPGQTPLDRLLARAPQVLYIDGLAGLHSGVNALSGDFSLQADGQLYQDGKRQQSVARITVAGNFFDLLRQIEALENQVYPEDFALVHPVLCPAVYLPALKVAGEA